MEVHPHDQYINRIDGSQRLTRKNRKFLRLYNPASTSIDSTSFLDSYKSLPSPYERNMTTSHKYCNSLNNIGDHSCDTNTGKLI